MASTYLQKVLGRIRKTRLPETWLTLEAVGFSFGVCRNSFRPFPKSKMKDQLLGYVTADSLFAWLTNQSSTPVMADAANFDKKALNQIWGDYPLCFLCEKANAEHFHHLWKRGYNLGYKGRHRKLFSSVMNACSLCSTCHNQGNIHYSEIRHLLAKKVYSQVMSAISNGLYKLTPIDYQFLSTFYDDSITISFEA